MFIILFILFIGIPLLKEEMENQSYRNECRRRGYDTYWSTDGLRYTNNNTKVYKQAGKSMLIKNEILHDKDCTYLEFQGEKKTSLDELIDWVKTLQML